MDLPHHWPRGLVASTCVALALCVSSCGSASHSQPTASAQAIQPDAARGEQGTVASPRCAATVARTFEGVAARIYRLAATGQDAAQAVRRVQRSTALADAISAGDAGAARAALRSLLLKQIVAIEVLRDGRRFASAGHGPAIAPVGGAIPGTGASFVLSVQADRAYLEVARQVTGAQVLLIGRHRRRELAGTLRGPVPVGVLAAGALTYRGQRYRVSSLGGRAYPSGALRIAVLVPSASIACPGSLAQARVETLGEVGQRVYREELHSPVVSATLRLLEGSRGFVRSVASQDASAARRAIVGFFRAHIHVVRVRVTVGAAASGGRLLVDVGGPYVLAPVRGALRSGGRTIGHFEMSIQDDAGYLKLAHELTGAQVLLRAGSRQLMGTLSPGPASLPARGLISYGGDAYRAYSFTGEAFPSGPLRISLLLPG